MVLENNICCDTHMEHIHTFCGLHVLYLGLNLAVGLLTPRLWTVKDRGSSLSVVSLLQAGNSEKNVSIPGTGGDHALCHSFTQSLRPAHHNVQRAQRSPSPRRVCKQTDRFLPPSPTEKSPSFEVNNSTAKQEVTRILWKPEVHPQPHRSS